MPLFRRKPTTITAVQFDGHPSKDPPGVFRRAEDDTPYVVTIHGQRAYLTPGDWIAPEPDGVHHYPINPSIFANTYEPVQAPADPPLTHEDDPAMLRCCAPGCDKVATFGVIAENAPPTPDNIGETQACDAHLVEIGLTTLAGHPEATGWRVWPLGRSIPAT